MKKRIILLALLLPLLSVWSCDKKDPSNPSSGETPPATDTTPATLSDFGFFSSDNDGLFPTDICVKEPAEGDIKLRLPYGLSAEQLKTLKPRFELSGNGEIRLADGTPVQSGAAIDFTNPVSFTLVSGETSKTYRVSVSVRSKPEFKIKAAAGVEVATTNTAQSNDVPYLNVNPTDGCAYVAINDAAAKRLERKLLLFKYDGTSDIELVTGGPLLSDRTGVTPAVGFDKKGTPYVAFADYTDDTNSSSRQSEVSVVKVSGGKASLLGGPKEIGAVFSGFHPYILPIDDNDVWVLSAPIDATTYKIGVYHYGGTSWERQTLAESAYFTRDTYPCGIADRGYVYVSYIDSDATKVDVIQFRDGAWSRLVSNLSFYRPDFSVIKSFKFPGRGIAVDDAGNLYLQLLADIDKSGEVKLALFRRPAGGGKMEQIGSAIPEVLYTTRVNTSVAMSYSTGGYQPTICYYDVSKGDWSEDVAPSLDAFCVTSQMRFNATGRGFVAWKNSDNELVICSID